LVWLRSELGSALEAAGLGAVPGARLAEASVGGRTPLREAHVAGRRLLVREYSHGGLAGRLLRALGLARTFLSPRRPFDELALFERLAAVSVPVPEVAFARARRARSGWHLELGTFALESATEARAGSAAAAAKRSAEGAGPSGAATTDVNAHNLGVLDLGALDLGTWLGRRRLGVVSPRAAQRVARAAGKLIARLHEVGFQHADLQPANLFVLGDPTATMPVMYALDLDGSRFLPDLDARARHQNLARLWRHVRRREELYGPSHSRTDRARLLRAWAQNSRRGARPEGARALWRAAWTAIDQIEARGRLWHRLGWSIERPFGHRHDDRAAQ